MWSALLGYPPTPAMPAGAFPLLAKLALGRAEGLHAWETFGRMSLDAGRTEGYMIGNLQWVALILLALLAAQFYRVIRGR